jgi:hypothetical protein
MSEEKRELVGGRAKATCHKLMNREIRTAEFAEFELLTFVPLLFSLYIFRKRRENSPSKKLNLTVEQQDITHLTHQFLYTSFRYVSW